MEQFNESHIVPFDFGNRLSSARKEKHYTQQYVAELTGITKATISNYERNIITPSLDILKKLARIYGKSIDYLVGYADRSHIYIDNLSPSQQKTVLSILELLRKEFEINNKED